MAGFHIGERLPTQKRIIFRIEQKRWNGNAVEIADRTGLPPIILRISESMNARRVAVVKNGKTPDVMNSCGIDLRWKSLCLGFNLGS